MAGGERGPGVLARFSRTGFLGQSLLYAVGAGTNAVLKFILVPIYSRHLSPAQFGLLGVCTSSMGLVTLLVTFGMDEAVSREYYDLRSAPSHLRSQLRRVATFVTVQTMLVLGFVQVFLWSMGTHFTVPLLLAGLVVLAGGLLALFGVQNALLRVMQKASHYSAGLNLKISVMFLLTLGLLLGTRAGVYAVFWGELGATLVVLSLGRRWVMSGSAPSGAGIVVTMATHTEDPGPVPPFSHTLRLAFPYFLYAFTNWILNASDRLVLARYLPMAEVGRYSFGYLVAFSVNILIVTSVNSAYLPRFMEQAHLPRGKWSFGRDVEWYALGLGFLILLGMLFAGDVVQAFAPRNYQGAEEVTKVVIYSYFFLGLYQMVALPIIYAKAPRDLAVSSMLGAGVNLGMNVILVPRFGAIVAAWTTMAGYGVMFLFAYLKAKKYYSIQFRFPLLAMIALALGGTGLGFSKSSLAVRGLVLTVAVILLVFGYLNVKRRHGNLHDSLSS